MAKEYIEREAVLDYIDHMPSELTHDGRRMIRLFAAIMEVETHEA